MGLSHLNPHVGSHVRGKIKSVLRWLTDPKVVLPEPEHRRARLLSYMLLTLVLLLGVTGVLVLIVNRDQVPRRDQYAILVTGLMILLLVAFGLNRAGHRTASARLTIACAIFGPWCSILMDPAVLRGDFVPVTYIVLSILLTSMLLSARATVILSAIQFLAVLCIPLFDPATTTINWPSFMAFICFASLLGVVFNLITQQDLEQIYRQSSLLAESEARLRELSVRDSLTGLYNRRYMQEALEREIQRAEQKHVPLSVIMIDMDGLKQINDTYGHSIGDEALRQVARLIFKYLRDDDIACRYGGDEFIIILPDTALGAARQYAEQLRESAVHVHIHYKDHLFDTFTLSLGVAGYPQNGSTAGALLKAADTALYSAKHEGRDRVVVAESPVMSAFIG
jgi:diguanylate cyclase (GGDEF)-like protein